MQQQPTMVTTTATVVQSQSRPMNMKKSAILALGITQVVIGGLVFFCGIAVIAALYNYWVNHSGTAVVAGIWLIVTGAIGISSAKNPLNTCLNGTNMAFNIIACVGAFLDASFFGAAIGHYNDCQNVRNTWNHYNYRYQYNYYNYNWECYDEINTARGLYGFLLFAMIVEFFIALTISILCCQANRCCGGSASNNGVIIQNAQPAVVYQGAPTVVSTTYPATTAMYQTDKSPYPPPVYQQQQQAYQQQQPQVYQQQQPQYAYPPQDQQQMNSTNPPPPNYDNGAMPPAYNP